MIHIDEYCQLLNMSRRQIERQISNCSLAATKINGQRYIITLPSADADAFGNPEQFVREIREYVAEGGTGYIKEALKRVAEFEKHTGKKLRGVSSKVLYKIADKKLSVHRKKRSDTGSARNSNLNLSMEKVQAIAAQLYLKLGQKDARFITTRVMEMAQRNDFLYEVAAVPYSTLYRYIRNWIKENDSNNMMYKYYNRHKDFLAALPKVYGAFTDHIDFMEYIAFDDRKADVAGSIYYDPLDGKEKLRKVWYWLAIEMKTMMPVGWVILPREPNSDDVINVLLQTMLNVGIPKKGYLFDNGIGDSDKVRKFMERVKLQCTGSEYFTEAYKPVAPYEPTHKANVERFFRFIKDEHDALIGNFVGGKREDVRHSSKRLSPEDCDHLVSEYISSADAYLTGDCINRKRSRRVNSAGNNISISELFNNFSADYQPYFLTDQSMRWALMDDTNIKRYKGGITIYRDNIRYNYTDVNYLPAMEGREFIISMMPTDLSKIDLYATEDFRDDYTGTMFSKGQYVCTLQSMNSVPNAEMQRITAKKRKEAGKHARLLKSKLLESALARFPELIPLVNTHITIDGEALDVRKQLLARMQNITESTPLNSIADFVRTECAEITTGKPVMELTINQDSQEQEQPLTLTIEGVEVPK